MKFLVDAQLPRRLARVLSEAGHDTVHTLALVAGNRTSDHDLLVLADNEDRVVLSKDSDFVDSFLLRGRPRKLLLISTGNISNDDLVHLVKTNLAPIETALAKHNFVELTRTTLTIHT